MSKTKIEIHENICNNLHEVYKAKNADYGDSFTKTREMYDNAILIRLTDKLERLKVLLGGQAAKVDESIDDTLMDLANYAIMELVERQVEKGQAKNAIYYKHNRVIYK